MLKLNDFDREQQNMNIPSAPNGDENYRAQGDAAPTRVMTPIRKVDIEDAAANMPEQSIREETVAPAAEGEPVVRRRRSRAAERRQAEAAMTAAAESVAEPSVVSAPQPVAEEVKNEGSFDPFSAGDSEVDATVAPMPVYERRQENQEENFTGALVARPATPARPVQPVPVEFETDAEPASDAGETPVPAINYRRPAAATVDRKPYDFEETEEEPKKKGSIWVPILVVLALIAAMIAGILLPDWTSYKNKSGAMGSVAGFVEPVQQGAVQICFYPA